MFKVGEWIKIFKQRRIWQFVVALSLAVGVVGMVPVIGQAKTKQTIKVVSTKMAQPHAYALKTRAVAYKNQNLTSKVTLTKANHKAAWYRDQLADIKVNGKKTRFYHVTSITGQKSFWIETCDLQAIYSSQFHPKYQLPAAYNGKIAVLGDSIPAGWDGVRLNHGNSYFDWFGQYVHMNHKRLHNYAIPDAKIVGHRYITYNSGIEHGQDLSTQILQHKAQLKKMNYIYVAIGTNDYTKASGSGSLTNIGGKLTTYLKYLKKLNPKAKVIGILPLTRYTMKSNVNCDTFANDRGFTLKQERDYLKKVYHKQHVKVVDFQQLAPSIITDQNHATTLNDGYLHPTVQTNQRLGLALAQTFTN